MDGSHLLGFISFLDSSGGKKVSGMRDEGGGIREEDSNSDSESESESESDSDSDS
jgi:hypothetical protein